MAPFRYALAPYTTARCCVGLSLAIGSFLLAPLVARGALVFSEIMYDLPGSDTLPESSIDREWVEIINCGPDTITIKTGSGSGSWRFNYGTSENRILNAPVQGSTTINQNDVLVLVGDATTFLAEHPGAPGTIVDTVMPLKNTAATLRLLDGSRTTVAETSYDSAVGAKGNGRTLERPNPCTNPPAAWQESAADGGTPGVVAAATPPPPPAPEPTPPTPTPPSSSNPQPPPKPLPRVALSEFLPDPIDDDSAGEWIEITNLEDREANVSGLMLDDSTAGGAYTFPDKTSIAPSGYLAVPRSTSKIALTNTGDEVKLMWPSGEFIEVVPFGKAPEGASYAKDVTGSWSWTYQPTHAAANVFAEKLKQPKAPAPTTTAPLPQQPPDTESEYEGRVEQTQQSTQAQPQAAAQLPLNATGDQPPQRTTQRAAAPTESERATALSPPSPAATSQLLAASLPNQSPNIPPWLLGVSILAGGALVGGLVSRFLMRQG